MIKHKIVKKFQTLQELDEWLNSWKRKLLEKIGMFRWTLDSPVYCCCDTTPYNMDKEYIDTHYYGDIIPLFSCMKAHYGWDCYDTDGCFLGQLVGIRATQEDMYWIIKREAKTTYLTCCAKIEFSITGPAGMLA